MNLNITSINYMRTILILGLFMVRIVENNLNHYKLKYNSTEKKKAKILHIIKYKI